MNTMCKIIAALPTLALGITVFLIAGLSFDMKKTIFLIIPLIWAFLIVSHSYSTTVEEVKELFTKLRK